MTPRAAALLAFVNLTLLALSGPALAVPVSVSAGETDGAERLIFDWPVAVDYSAERFGNTLVIRFSQPIEADIAAAASGLGRFVASGRVGRDGRSAVIELTGNHRLRSSRDGNRIVIDLFDRTASPPPAAAPPPVAAPAAASTPPPPAAATVSTPSPAAPAGLPLGVRTGRHADYDRIVFDWPASVGFSLEQAPEQARVVFDRPAQVDDAAVRRRLPEALRGFATGNEAGGLVATIPVPAGRSVNAFRAGTRVVVDVLRGAGNPPSPAPAVAQQSPASAPTPAVSPPVATAPPPAAGQPPVPAGQASSGTASGALETTVPTVDPSRAERPPSDDAVPNPATRMSAGTDADRAIIGGPPLPVVRLNNAEAISLRFGFEEPTAAVIFPRAGYIWLGFDRAVTMDFSTLANVETEIVGQPEQIPVSVGSAVRLPVVDGVNARVWRDGEAWVVDIQPQASRPDVPLRVDAQMVSPQGPRLFIPVDGIGQPIVARDPEVGDGLFMIPVTPLSRGIDGDRTYPGLSLLASLQGVVVRPNRQDIEVRILPDGIALTRNGGMLLSGSAPRTSDELFIGNRFQGLSAGLPPGRIFDMSNWRLGKDGDYLDRRQALQTRISEATSISRSRPRLELAQFYFSRGLSAEAIGLLRTIEQSDEDLANRPDVKALRGAASFMLGRYAEAEDYLDDPALNGFSEAELWRGAATAGQGKWDEAVEHFARAGEIPGGYPRNYTTDLAMLAAEAAIRAGDFRGAGAFLDVISEGTPTPGERARLDFLRGRVLYAFGDTEAALDIWNRLAEGEDRWARVRSERSLIEHALDNDRVSVKQAADGLDELRYAWRGDRLEFELLRDLGRLRLQENEYEEGLDALRQAVTNFPDHQEAQDVAFELTKAFGEIFTGGAVEGMTPLQALSLYDEFRELTPVGKAGDVIIEALADRLVRVDLLDRAARLLDRQVKFRLQGSEKARVGARLALILLLDRHPESAIRALDESVAPGLGGALAQERRRLRARAIFELGDAQGSLKLMADDQSREADLLRADIYWRTQDWIEAAKVFRTLVGAAGRDGRRLTSEQATFIVNWAVALALSDNDQGLNRLRQIYGPQMDNTPFREAFRLITNNTDSGPDEFLRLSERFEEIGRFQAFLSSYRDKLKQGPLSATN